MGFHYPLFREEGQIEGCLEFCCRFYTFGPPPTSQETEGGKTPDFELPLQAELEWNADNFGSDFFERPDALEKQ